MRACVPGGMPVSIPGRSQDRLHERQATITRSGAQRDMGIQRLEVGGMSSACRCSQRKGGPIRLTAIDRGVHSPATVRCLFMMFVYDPSVRLYSPWSNAVSKGTPVRGLWAPCIWRVRSFWQDCAMRPLMKSNASCDRFPNTACSFDHLAFRL